jgi:hypothetical protein
MMQPRGVGKHAVIPLVIPPPAPKLRRRSWGVFAMLTGRLGSSGSGWPLGRGGVVGSHRPFPCHAAQEVSAPDGSTPVGEVVSVV